ncbi:NADP-dependent oxidoreductase [Streptomyces sp. V4-01]|uniref:NADP-dependent oxidoreductase n=1 Tax=Actinacidiphila polyblastidii TaxID=3110430 RepID=A0ABU7P681_9ACTN|nr:NADP-dependent oxidoreductase [Streptomyces sp. V4-01]
MRLGREMHLVARPARLIPEAGDVRLIEVPVPDPKPGEVLVRNLYMSIDPGALMHMKDLSALDIPHFATDTAMWCDAVGEVIESADEDLKAGDIVWHRLGWRDYAVASATRFRRVDAGAYPSLTHHLCFGIVAYIGIELAGIRPGDTVLVSSAVGGVGSIAGQIARLRGASKVIGSVGSARKVAYAKETLRYDAAFDHHDEDFRLQDDIDVYFDSVGGRQLEAAIDAMRPRGRIVVCGQTEQLHSGVPNGPRNMMTLVRKRLGLQAYYTFDHPDLVPKFEEEFPQWVRSGDLVVAETVVHGLENGVDAAVGQMRGEYVGKVVLRL